MLRDITLGQYFPGSSVIHTLDPRTKLVVVFVYIVLLFVGNSFVSYIVLGALLAACIAASGIKLKMLLRGIKPVIIILIFTAVLNIFFTPGTPVFTLWRISVTYEGLRMAAYLIIRIVMLITGTLLLTYTTSPLALTDGLEALMRPLKKIKVPVHELTMMMSIALKFIPILIEETDKIMSAQKARGADFETGNLIQKAKAMMPLLIPLFISSLRRAEELAMAMESRCYHGDDGRTRMKQLVFAGRDYAAFALTAVTAAVMITLAVFGF